MTALLPMVAWVVRAALGPYVQSLDEQLLHAAKKEAAIEAAIPESSRNASSRNPLPAEGGMLDTKEAPRPDTAYESRSNALSL